MQKKAVKNEIKRALIFLGYSVLIVTIIAVLVFFIWFYPEQQISSSEKLTANEIKIIELRNEARKTNAQLVGGLVLLFGLYLTYKRITVTERNVQVAQEGQITERFTRAIEQLGNRKRVIRLGGIYALERIAKDSADDHWTIMEVLTTYVRENAPWPEEKQESEQNQKSKEKIIKKPSEPTKTPADIQAILTVIGRRQWIDKEKNFINLDNTNLHKANLYKANLSKADLTDANLSNANLVDANLVEANLTDADLSGANLTEANLFRADLSGADLSRANLSRANLTAANLAGANLSRADLSRANLTGANLAGADVNGADFSGADLSKANLSGADLTEAILDGARYDKSTLLGHALNQEQMDGMVMRES